MMRARHILLGLKGILCMFVSTDRFDLYCDGCQVACGSIRDLDIRDEVLFGDEDGLLADGHEIQVVRSLNKGDLMEGAEVRVWDLIGALLQ